MALKASKAIAEGLRFFAGSIQKSASDNLPRFYLPLISRWEIAFDYGTGHGTLWIVIA
jgi:hypothetical protein